MEEKSLFDLLLDEENIIDKKKELEVSRLSKKFGKKFIITIRTLTQSEIDKCLNDNITIESADFILESATVDGKSFKDVALQQKFNVQIARDVLKKIFTNGEIRNIYYQILKLNGLTSDTVVELKN